MESGLYADQGVTLPCDISVATFKLGSFVFMERQLAFGPWRAMYLAETFGNFVGISFTDANWCLFFLRA